MDLNSNMRDFCENPLLRFLKTAYFDYDPYYYLKKSFNRKNKMPFLRNGYLNIFEDLFSMKILTGITHINDQANT